MMKEHPSIESLLAILREAGSLILTMQNDIVRMPSKRHIKQDGSFVTEADMQSLQLIAKKLRSLTPGIPILAEEQPMDVNKTILGSNEQFWLVDSLDNTHDYALGGKNFSINLALIGSNGHAEMGVLFFPGLGEAYFKGDDGRAYKQISKEAVQQIHVIPFNPAHEDMLKVAQHPHRVSNFNSFLGKPMSFITSRGQRRACMVATGEVALCVETEGFYIWDTAPVAAILEAAGGGVYNLEDGELLTFHHGLRLPAYAAAASRDIPQKMNLFGLHGVMVPPEQADIAMRKSGNI